MFLIYETETKIIVFKNYQTERGAKHAATRLMNSGHVPVSVSDMKTFYETIDYKVTKINIMTGKEYQESVNTPLCCSPASETYWSM